MQIKENIYNWLVGLQVIQPDGKKYADKVEIPKTTVQVLESGIAFANLLRELVKLRNRPMTPLTRLDSLKDNQQKSSYLYNWKILVEEYAKIGITIDQDTKALILGGDKEMIHQLLAEIYETNRQPTQQLTQSMAILDESLNNSQARLAATNKISQGMKLTNQQVDLSKLNVKDLNKTHNCLEFFIVALAKNLQLTTKQAASLFTNNNKYLAHILAKGVKGIFEPIVSFYKEVFANANQLNKLFSEDGTRKSLVFAFQALKPGMISKSFEVAYEAIRLFNKLASIVSPIPKEWFFEEQGGLYTSLMGARRHPDLVQLHVELIYIFGRNSFVEVFTNGIKKVLPETQEYINSIELIFPPLSQNKELVSTGILNDWVTQAIGIAENEFKNSVDTRISALNLLTEVLLRSELDDTLSNAIISLLKKGCRDKSISLTLLSLNHLFRLLNHFGQEKSNYAPLIYKNLTLSLIENHDNQMTREFILNNFANTFSQLESIPTSLLIENLIKQMQTSEGVTYILNTFDMQFFMFLSNQNIGIKNAIQLLDLLAKVFLNNIVYQSVSSEIIVNILSKNADNQTMQEFILKFVKIALAMYFASEKKKTGKDPIQAQKRNQIVEIIKTIVQFQQIALNDKVKPLVAHTNIQIKQFSKKNSKGMMAILELFGNADRILEIYEVEYREQQARQLVASDEEDVSIIYPKSGKMTKEEQYSLASLKTSKADPKVLEKLETIKKNYVDKVTTKVAKIENQKEAQSKQKTNLRKQLEKRSIEQGVSIVKDRETNLIFKDGQKQPPPQNKHGLTEYEVYDLNYEEDREKMLIEQIFRKFHKVLKHLFIKYANTGHKINKPKDFDNLQEQSDTINEPEIWQFLKEYELIFHVSREQVHALLRAVATQLLKSKNELQNFNYEGFKHIITQYSIIIFTRNNKYMAPHQCLDKFILQLKQVTASRGETTQLYDDPENMYFSQTEVIKEFNKKLQEDPSYPLPEGYKSVKEQKIDFHYILKIDEGTSAVYEIMDSIFEKAFDTHLIEPITQVSFQDVCRPNLLGYVKSKVAERLNGSYIELDPKAQKKLKIREASLSVKSLPKRNLEIEPLRSQTLGIKLGLAQISFKDRGLAEQVANVLDDMLYALENDKKTIDRKSKIVNRALKDQEVDKQKDINNQVKRDDKFKKHSEEVKQQLEQLKKKKEEQDKKEANEQDTVEKKKKQIQDQKLQERQQYLKEQKGKSQVKVKQDEEERLREELKQKNLKAQEIQQKKEKFKQFNSEKIKEFKQLYEAEKQRTTEIEEKKRQKEQKDAFVYQQLYSVIEKKGENIKQKEKATSDKIFETFNQQDIQECFLKHNIKLSHLFELLLLETYQSLAMLDNKDLVLKIWMWFGERFCIYPEVITQLDFIRIFNTLTYKKPQKPAVLTYQEFLQALLRVSIKGYQFFNKLATKTEKQPQPQFEEPPQSVKRTHQTKEFMKDNIKQEISEQERRLKQVNDDLKEQKRIEKEALLIDNYKGLSDFNKETLNALITYLALPNDKQGIELRFRYLMEEESLKKPNRLKKQEANAKLDEDYEQWKEIQAIEQRRQKPINKTQIPKKQPIIPVEQAEEEEEQQEQQEQPVEGEA